jgi:hypothetical protein
MMEKSAQPGEGGGCTPPPLSLYLYNLVVYTPAEREDTFPIFLLNSYMYSVFRATEQRARGTYPMGSHTVDTQGLAYQFDRMQITNSSRGVRIPVQWAGLYCVRIMQKCTNV